MAGGRLARPDGDDPRNCVATNCRCSDATLVVRMLSRVNKIHLFGESVCFYGWLPERFVTVLGIDQRGTTPLDKSSIRVVLYKKKTVEKVHFLESVN